MVAKPDNETPVGRRRKRGRESPVAWWVVFGALVVLVLVCGVAVLAVMLAVIRPLREKAETYELEDVLKIERASVTCAAPSDSRSLSA